MPERKAIYVYEADMAGAAVSETAKVACQYYDAVPKVGRGKTGSAYAIPTRGTALELLPLGEIKQYVTTFIRYAEKYPKKDFKIAPIGLGSNDYLEYGEKAIAQLFAKAPDNCEIPERWKKHLPK